MHRRNIYTVSVSGITLSNVDRFWIDVSFTVVTMKFLYTNVELNFATSPELCCCTTSAHHARETVSQKSVPL